MFAEMVEKLGLIKEAYPHLYNLTAREEPNQGIQMLSCLFQLDRIIKMRYSVM